MNEGVQAAESEWLQGWLSGPTRVRWDVLPPQVGDPAPDAELAAADGATMALSHLWRDRPALLLFWRHYGCSCGMDRAARLREEYEGYMEAGAQVAVIGQCDPVRAKAYSERQGIRCPVLCDPEREVYRAYGLLQGDTPHILFDAPDEFLRREAEAGRGLQDSRRDTERALVDDPWQLPGEFVIGTDGTIRLAYRYQYCVDYPDPRVHVAAVRLAGGDLTP